MSTQSYVVVTPPVKRAILAAVEATLSTSPDMFGFTESAVERAKRRPQGRQVVKSLTAAANGEDLEYVELVFEVYRGVLRDRQAKLRKEKEKRAERTETTLQRREARKQAKQQAAHEADKARRKAEREALSRANTPEPGKPAEAA